mmetsp:Transcript_1252/g.3777  ORF Transcript_1252/g.3777 Transcript_1252/m.3777 type:complete len:507 (+) Transcript_1252:858-2378(+)
MVVRDLGADPAMVRRRHQGARGGELLLPVVRDQGGARGGGGPRRRVRAGGGLGDQVGLERSARADRDPAYLGDHHVPGIRQVAPIPPGPPAQAEPVVLRRALGVQVPDAVPEVARVLVARGTHGARRPGRGGRDGLGHSHAVPAGLRAPPRRPRHPRDEDREGKVRRRVPDDDGRSLRLGQRPRDPGRDLAQPRTKFWQNLRHRGRGRERRQDHSVADLLGSDDSIHRRLRHGSRRRSGPRAAAARRPGASRRDSPRLQDLHPRRPRALRRPRQGRARGLSRQGRCADQLLTRLEVQPLGAKRRPAPPRGRPARRRGRRRHRRAPRRRPQEVHPARRPRRRRRRRPRPGARHHARQGHARKGRQAQARHHLGRLRPRPRRQLPRPHALVRPRRPGRRGGRQGPLPPRGPRQSRRRLGGRPHRDLARRQNTLHPQRPAHTPPRRHHRLLLHRQARHLLVPLGTILLTPALPPSLLPAHPLYPILSYPILSCLRGPSPSLPRPTSCLG